MKKILLAASCAFIVFFETGCKEIGPAVNLTASSADNDSMYTLTATQIAALTTDPHHVLAEEFTGQMCANCPSARDFLAGQSAANPGRIHVIGLYIHNIAQANPTPESVYDFRDSIATKIGSTIYGGIGSLPSGGIDRKQDPTNNNQIITPRTLWPDNITTQLAIIDSLNLSVTSSYDVATSTARVVATITYTQPVTIKHNLSVVLIEGEMEDPQEFPDGVHHGYTFSHVFRDMISSSPVGDPVLDTVAVKARGRVLQRTFLYKLKTKSPAIVPAHCEVVAFINNTGGGKLNIVQSAETKFAP